MVLAVAVIAATCSQPEPDAGGVVVTPPPAEWYAPDGYEHPDIEDLMAGEYPDPPPVLLSDGLVDAINSRWRMDPATEWAMCLVGEVRNDTVYVHWYVDPGYYYRFHDRVFGASCPIGTVGDIHSHPGSQCYPSLPDLVAFKASISYHAQPMIFTAIACGTQGRKHIGVFGWGFLAKIEQMKGPIYIKPDPVDVEDYLKDDPKYLRYREIQDSIAGMGQ